MHQPAVADGHPEMAAIKCVMHWALIRKFTVSLISLVTSTMAGDWFNFIQVGVTSDGRILALDVNVFANGGCQLELSGIVSSLFSMFTA